MTAYIFSYLNKYLTGCNFVTGQEYNGQHFGFNEFLPVTSAHYSDREKLISSIREVASTLGFATVIKK